MERCPYAVVASYGYDARHTPLDVLMRGPEQMHRDVAYAMEHAEDGDTFE